MPGSRFKNLVAAEVTRLKPSENQSLLTSAATVLKETPCPEHFSPENFVLVHVTCGVLRENDVPPPRPLQSPLLAML